MALNWNELHQAHCILLAGGIFNGCLFFCFLFLFLRNSQAIGHVSGGHINPAVTVAMLITGKISLIRAILYIIVQCAGATAGTGSLKALLPESLQNNLGHTALYELGTDVITPMQGLGLEFFLGFILVFTVFGVCDGNKPGKKRLIDTACRTIWLIWMVFVCVCVHSDSKYIAPLAIGLAVTVGHLGTIKYTGSSMNPARTFGTAVVTNQWANHWVSTKRKHMKTVEWMFWLISISIPHRSTGLDRFWVVPSHPSCIHKHSAHPMSKIALKNTAPMPMRKRWDKEHLYYKHIIPTIPHTHTHTQTHFTFRIKP